MRAVGGPGDDSVRDAARAAVESVRRPEHVGENRCWPCTAVNAAIVGGVAALAVASGRLPVAVGVAVLGGALVWSRGYVVPYTPRFAPALARRLPGDVFPHADEVTIDTMAPSDPGADGTPGREAGGEASTATDSAGGGGAGGDSRGPREAGPESAAARPDEDLVDDLVAAGVLVAEGEDVRLSSAFADAWWGTMAELRPLSEWTLASVLEGTVPWAADVDVVETDVGTRFVLDDGTESVEGEAWLSRQVAVAELAAVRTLEAEAGVPSDRGLAVAPALRAFLDRCPACETPLEESTRSSCCGRPPSGFEAQQWVRACPACETPVYHFESEPP
jgi:hypothetical protein